LHIKLLFTNILKNISVRFIKLRNKTKSEKKVFKMWDEEDIENEDIDSEEPLPDFVYEVEE
jgi:hypothetical protein